MGNWGGSIGERCALELVWDPSTFLREDVAPFLCRTEAPRRHHVQPPAGVAHRFSKSRSEAACR